jgi:uncharacterized protein YecE (DUF72 family)
MFYSGISGLQLPTPRYLMDENQHHKSRLEIYSGMFNSIEINSSFYRIPVAKTITKWSGIVGQKFRFTFKLFKEISHAKRLDFAVEHVRYFLSAIEIFPNQKGALLIQLPPSIKSENIGQLGNLLHIIRKHDSSNSWDLAVEFRSKDWYNDELYELIEAHNAAVVMHDKASSATPLSVTGISDVIYLRFHGPTGNYRGSYPTEFLQEYALYIQEWLSEEKTIYCYFNNTMGDAVGNLMTLNAMVANK